MDTSSLLSLVEQLEDNLDELDDNLAPLTADALSTTIKKLPLLDRAKLQVTTVYAIESLLFSYLKLNGVDAKGHPIFQEINRIKKYFEKIEEAEKGVQKPRENMSLNKQAAARIIHHALAGNDKIDLERREREAREKFLAARKLKAIETAMKEKAAITEQTQPLSSTSIPGLEESTSEGAVEPSLQSTEQSPKKNKKSSKKRKHNSTEGQSSKLTSEQKAEKKARKKASKSAGQTGQPD